MWYHSLVGLKLISKTFLGYLLSVVSNPNTKERGREACLEPTRVVDVKGPFVG
jgi:hypothetical protein